jgi:hypothetical protein
LSTERAAEPCLFGSVVGAGWWAHLTFDRTNIALTILKKEIASLTCVYGASVHIAA